MTPVTRVAGIAVALPRDNIDTDAIIPQRYLVTVDKEGMAEGFFGGWRTTEQGGPDMAFPLNRPKHAGARILLAGANYGCGSSREHAVWAHLAWGIRAVVAPSFGPIFFGNAAKNGLLLVTLPPPRMAELMAWQQRSPGPLAIDLPAQTITAGLGIIPFEIDARLKAALLTGSDELGETLAQASAIAAFQARDRARRPWVWDAAG